MVCATAGPVRASCFPPCCAQDCLLKKMRQACLHEEELGEEGIGNCRRYRELCR
jgi:hypothetical protein